MSVETHPIEKTSFKSTQVEKGGKIILASLGEYNQLQMKEMLGPTNMYLTGKALEHNPTPEEAAAHFLKNGGAENFAQRYTYPSKEYEKNI